MLTVENNQQRQVSGKLGKLSGVEVFRCPPPPVLETLIREESSHLGCARPRGLAVQHPPWFREPFSSARRCESQRDLLPHVYYFYSRICILISGHTLHLFLLEKNYL